MDKKSEEKRLFVCRHHHFAVAFVAAKWAANTEIEIENEIEYEIDIKDRGLGGGKKI